MEDTSPATNPTSGHERPEAPINRRQELSSDDGPLISSQSTSPHDAAAFEGQYQQIYAPPPPPNAFPNHFEVPPSQPSGRQGLYNMNGMANSLPQTQYRPGYSNGQHQRYTHSGLNMISPMGPYSGQLPMPQLTNQQYYLPQPQSIQAYYPTQMSPTAQHHQQHHIGPQRTGMDMSYYAGPFIMNQPQPPPHGYYYSHPTNFPAQNPVTHGHLGQTPYYPPGGASGDPRDSSNLYGNNNGRGLGGSASNEESTENRPSIVRGPPRKPRQSGHAIWIGNLPPQTDLMSLVHHVCRETTGLESLFLISKSNCAFANFKDETSCTTAQQKLHDSKFQSVRLVSRLRKSTVEGSSGQTAPTGPAAISPNTQTISSDRTPSNPRSRSTNVSSPQENGVGTMGSPTVDAAQQKDKFFILKSLTVEDLDLSIRNGVWATQSHNEEALNEAFKTADTVYLIFSANKSGEYFGYAKMTSPINDDPAAAIEFAPKAQTTNSMDLPKAIPTEATETCPRGRIIDDSARGTIFWEIEEEEVDGMTDAVSEDSESARDNHDGHDGHDGEAGPKAWGKPFKLEWLSTTKLPFYRTRDLRNRWNSNREVKIARDGTELEPTVGRRLIGLFNRVQSPVPVAPIGVAAIPTGYPPQFH